MIIAIVTAMLAMIGLAFAGGTPAKASTSSTSATSATSASSATLSGLARSAAAQAQADTPVSPVNPGGDYTSTMNDGGVPAATMTQWISTTLPQSLGLSANPTLSNLATAVYNKYEVPGSGGTAPPSFTGGSISATSTGVTVTVPAASVPTDTSPGSKGKLAAFLGGLALLVSAVVVGGSCIWLAGVRNAAGGVTSKDQQAACAFLGTLTGGVSGFVTNDYFNSVPINGDEWTKAFLFSAPSATALGVFLSPWVQEMIAELGSKVAEWYAESVSPTWFGQGAAAVGNFFLSVFYKQPTTGNTMALGFTGAGLAAPVAAGNVGNVPTGTVVTAGSGDCMDAYQAGGTPSVGQIAAINACAASADQNWTEWSNGMITNGGLCLDDNGDSNPSDNAVVNLQACNGGYTQLWYEDGAGRVVDGETGTCLDDPGSNTKAGTQLRLYPCNNSTAQEWAPPGGTKAVTGFDRILSVLSSQGSQLCMMPQTSLANPVGSNIITEVAGGNVCFATATGRMWAVGSNGTLMANGTNALCMDSNGPATTGPGGEVAYFVRLEGCDGAQSQVWHVISTYLGPTLQNAGDGLCINTPSGESSLLVSMVVASCATPPYAGELWTLPGFSAPTTLLAGGPCDIYLYYGTPCGAAYSMDRAMYAGYDGPLYQVKRASDNTTKDIGLLATGGDVNATAQDSFCASTTCTITEIYDQSPDANNLTIEQSGGNASADQGAAADALPIKIGGNEAYGLDIEQGTGYRDDTTNGVATGSVPESMYMVASGTHVNYGCCFDFGNVETDNDDHGAGTMDAVNLTTWCGNNNTFPCSGGPWVEADLENGQWTGSGPNVEPASNSDFVTAMLSNNGQNTSNGLNSFELQGGNSQSGGLTTFYNGSLPSGYSPMKKQGAIVLGTGGDNSNTDVGSFFEGVMTVGYPTDAADAAVQANIVAAGYSGSTNPVASEAPSAAGQAVVHDGYSSVYTVDSANGDLEESYLPAMGDSWSKQDLSAKYGTPAVMPGTQPVAVLHCGFTSVYTVDAASGDLQETYLPAMGDGWLTQDLSSTGGTMPGTPPTNVTPTAVVHDAGAGAGSAGCDGYTSVYTVDRDGDLQETYLPNQGFPGDDWHTQDLSATGGTMAGTPQVLAGTSPVAIVHCGYTSVYTVDGNHDLQETYLAAIGGSWYTQDLSGTGGTLPGTPPANSTPTAVVHDAGAGAGSAGCDGYTSVYTVDQGSQDLQETYLPNQGFPGDDWHTQNLSAKYQAPPVAPGTQPEALVHMGFTSVYTIDEGSDQVQETYLSAIGSGWLSQSLSAKYQVPTTDQSPIVLLHQDTSGVFDWTSVFTVDEFNAHLQETYLPNAGFPGDSWQTQDLSSTGATMPDTPPVYVPQSSPASWSVAHGGYTSVYTGNSGGDLEETYLIAMGDGWTTQNLSSTGGDLPGAPLMLAGTTPVALVHDGYTSVYTIDAGDSTHAKGDLQETYLPAIGGPWYTQDLSHLAGTPASKVSPTAVFHDGYVSVYTADGSDGDLWETYLPGAGFPGDSWQSQNLTAKYHTPPVDAFTSPVAIVHDGYTSVYTVDTTNAADGSTLGDLQETYLPYMGDGWFTQNLSVKYGTPLVNILTSPTAVFHNGYTSVYTVDAANGHLSETYLPAMGDAWTTQDLTSETGGSPVAYGVQPVALYHTGYISVYTVDASNGHLRETYLTAIGGSWATQDLYPSAGSQVVAPFPSPSAVVHYDTSGGLTFTSVYTVDYSSGDVRETYLPVMGDLWSTQDLTAKYHTPAV